MSAEPSEEKRLLDWLYGTQMYGVKLGLESTQKLLTEFGLPTKDQRFIHVAGTNGKGSVCAFAHSILSAAGVNAGLFTSPHLIQFRERIRDSHGMIPHDDLVVILREVRQRVAEWDPHPTFFELSLIVALKWFAQKKLEWVVLETGMGGRLDATNAIQSAVTVITSISMDHQAALGNTLAAIAGEKAGIIKPGIPVITMKQNPQAMEVVSRTARERGAPMNIVTTPVRGYQLGLAGHHQLWNAAMAVAAVKAAGFKLTETILNPGLKNVSWPARFQNLDGANRMILDGAHNIDAAETLVRTWQHKFPGEKATIVFGAAANKDVRAVVRALQPIAARWCFTDFDSPRAANPAQVSEMHHAIYGDSFPSSVHENPKDALAEAAKHRQRVLITGSLYLAGEVLAQIRGERDLFEPSHQ
ncbi:MAG: bifunctional folylpolyglutamate synthase/dihydrofolate synthase [Verrucomicrobiaceae bacterium]|nr:bifunctional folylpolyglutamate synthase/dihydrofolate synthase [Verrucomicrobiaceae bacterium]